MRKLKLVCLYIPKLSDFRLGGGIYSQSDLLEYFLAKLTSKLE